MTDTLTLQGFPLLTLIILLPLFASVIVIFLDHKNSRLFSLFTFVLNLFLSALMLSQFDASNPNFQMIDTAQWISSLNIHYTLGVDGISVLFVPLTNLLFIGVVLSSWTHIRKQSNLYYSMLLLLATASIGIFVAIDTVSFFLFWELTLIPIYFLISLWGIGSNRRFAAGQYTLFMLVGGLPILIAFVLLAVNGADTQYIFNYTELIKQTLPADTQTIIFLALLLGFAVKTPIFPFHAWLPLVAMEGPAGVAAIMTGMKLGAYGLLRFAMPLAPDATASFHWLLAGLGVMGMLYGAIVAIRQTNLRKLLAYASISHVGLVVLGLASLNLQGIQGTVFQLLNFTLIASALFMLTGFLHHRLGSTDIRTLGGIAVTMPLLTSFFFVFGLASMGIPGTSGFAAELLLILSVLQSHMGAGIAALVVVVIGASYFLKIYQSAFLGPVTEEGVKNAVDLQPKELVIVFTFALIVIIIGIMPVLVLNIIEPTTEQWILNFQP